MTTTNRVGSDEILTVEELMAVGPFGKRTIYRAVREGRLRAARINARGDMRFRREWVRDWLESCASGGVSAAA
jgi:excisionase family DNA binding protein